MRHLDGRFPCAAAGHEHGRARCQIRSIRDRPRIYYGGSGWMRLGQPVPDRPIEAHRHAARRQTQINDDRKERHRSLCAVRPFMTLGVRSEQEIARRRAREAAAGL